MTTLIIQPSGKDTHLRQDEAATNFGTLTYIRVYNRSTRANRSILEFDLSGIPAGVTLNSATLELLYASYTPYDDPVGLTVWAYKLSRTDWVENEATYNSYKTGSVWTAAGGDYVTSAPAGGSTVFPASVGQWLSFNVLAIVNDAFGSSIDAEFLVKFETEGLAANYSLVGITSNNHATTATRPKLTFVYTGVAPTVTTYAMSNVVGTTATGNGNITNLGAPNPTAHGHCWNTTGTPTTSDNSVDNGAKAATGLFTSSLTGLTVGALYFVRAYATNLGGTGYGSQTSFTAVAGEKTGPIAVVETRFHYLDAYGTERYLEGTAV